MDLPRVTFSPAISAWAVDLSDEDKRGKSVATMYIALEAGIGLGAFFAGYFFQDVLQRIPYIFYGAGVANLVALFYILNYQKRKRQTLINKNAFI